MVKSYGGGISVPIGYRFCPTDEELIVHYLCKKQASQPLPSSVIPQLHYHYDLLHTHPLQFPGSLKEKRYFFTKRKRSEKLMSSTISIVRGRCRSRCKCGGYWKSVGKKNKEIVVNKKIIGIKNSFLFYPTTTGKKTNHHHHLDTRSRWIMDRLCLVAPSFLPNHTQQNLITQVGDWVVSGIYQRKRILIAKKESSKGGKGKGKGRRRGDIITKISNAQPLPSPSPSPCSSVITEEGEEEEMHNFIHSDQDITTT